MKNKYIAFILCKFNQFKKIVQSFSLTEKIILLLLVIIFIGSFFGILIKINNNFLIEIPDYGGTLVEGVIGTPRFVNPVIANSNIDRDLVSVIYSGLVKIDSNGEIKPDLAEHFEISEDGLIYDFYLRDNAQFHNNKKVTVDDVVFTILKVQDPEVRSPYITNWEGIAIEKVSDQQIRFILDNPDPNFLTKTNIGILPKHLWQEVDSESFSLSLYNISPIGSGPYKINNIERNAIGIPQSYTLKSFKNYTLGEPKIKKVVFLFSKNENELIDMINNGDIDTANGISPKTLEKIKSDNFNLITAPLPRVFGIFINQDESPALSIESARKALSLATPKSEIVKQIFNGYATLANNPIPNFDDGEDFQQNLEQAEKILIDDGWKKNTDGIYAIKNKDENYLLSTSISTSNVPELVEVAELIANEWKKIGIDVSVKVFNTNDLNQNVIRTRNFEILLFGTVINNYSDLYAFWHSSRRNDPGLNITNYTNIETDRILSEFLNTNEKDISEENIKKLIGEIKKDIPAIFLYSPKFIYLTSNKIKGIEIDSISNTSDRFNNISKWFIETDKIWKLFNR